MTETLKPVYLRIRRQLLLLLAPILGRRRRRHRKPPGKAPRLLFIRPDRIGDMVLSTAAFRALKKAFPRSHLSVLGSRVNFSLLGHNPYVDRVLIYPFGKNPLPKWRMIRALRKENFDVVIDPLDSYDLEPALLAGVICPRLAIGFEGFGREVFFDRVKKPSQSHSRFVDVSFDLLKMIGVEENNRQPELFLTPAETRCAEDWLATHARGGRVRVGIHPGAHYETQKWGVRNYAELILSARSAVDVEWILVGGPADAAIVESIQAEAGNGIPVFIDGNLRGTVALISRLDALVCNNSGPLHIANALNIPTVSCMGPTIAERWWPVASPCRVLRAGHLSCLGCEKGACPKKTTECMQRITPGMVLDALMSLLAEAGRVLPRPVFPAATRPWKDGGLNREISLCG